MSDRAPAARSTSSRTGQAASVLSVSESVHDSATLDRELSSLRAVRDNYPKTLITLDDERPYSHEGIRQVYALDWLLNEDHKKQ